jgi:rRNA biogenesis protein RRP5
MPEIDFPRGNAKELTPLEYRDISDQAKVDLFKTQDGKDSDGKSAKKRALSTDINLGKKLKLDEIPMLTFKQIKKGMCFLGVVKKIGELDLEIALPNQLTGYVSITEISDIVSQQVESVAQDDSDGAELPELSLMFQMGQPLVCAVVSIETHVKGSDSKKKIELSLNPKLINMPLHDSQLAPGMPIQACIVSKEDHGFVVDFGLKDVNGFMRISEAKEGCKF